MWTLFLRRPRISATENCGGAISLTKAGSWYEMLEERDAATVSVGESRLRNCWDSCTDPVPRVGKEIR
jgi:hypothetical protein